MIRKKKRWIIISSVIIFLIILFIASAEYTSHSKFCSTCHYMKPFYRSWQTSKHNKVECATCHYPPGFKSKLNSKILGLLQIGKYWTKLYLKSKPWAEIPDESCLRDGCHEKRLLEGRVKFKKVIFDHKIHLTDLKRGKKLRCTSCHSQIVQGKHITVTESTCFICHFKKSENYPRISDCSHCHEKKFLVSKEARFNHSRVFKNEFSCDKCHTYVVLGDGIVPRANCFKCHWEVDRLNKYDDTDLMHKTHISEHKIECLQCHLAIRHKIVRKIETLVDCQTCHPNHHQAQKVLFSGEGGKGHLKRIPSIMFEKGLSCKGCHIFHEDKGGKLIKGRTFISSPKACETCHGEGFSRILWEWEKATEKKLNKIKSIYEKISQKIKRSKNGDKEKIKKFLDDAALNIDIVEQGKGVHNVQYAEQLLSAAYDILITALKEAGVSYRPEKFIVKEEKIPSECATCHTGIEEISVSVYGSTFSHGKHILKRGLKCSKCHSNIRQHGEFILSKKDCARCHHINSKKECEKCHTIQKKMYIGELISYKDTSPDVMFEAGVECKDCHLNEQDQVIRPGKNKCVECHESGYDEMMVEWQNTIKEKIFLIESLMRKAKKSFIYKNNGAFFDGIRKELEIIKNEGSYGVHNYSLIDEYLDALKEKLNNFSQTK